MRAIILAAGQGTRLGDLTRSSPKCLVTLEGRTLLERQIGALRRGGVTEIGVVAGYCADQVRAAAAGCTIFENTEFATSNMLHSLMAAGAWLDGSEDVLVVYGDIVFEDELITELRTSSGDVSVIVDDNWREYWAARMPDPLQDAETMIIDAAGRIRNLGDKPTRYDDIHAQYIGLFKIAAPAVAGVVRTYQQLDPAVRFRGRALRQLYMTDFLQILIDAGFAIVAVRHRNGWLEVDRVDDLRLYAQLAARGELDRFCRLAAGT